MYALRNTAQPGRMPVEELVSTGTAYYSRLNIGTQRMYQAKGANTSVDVLARCHNTPSLPDGTQYAILEDDKQYRIDLTQERPNLDAVDLTLVRLGENYAVADET